MLLVVDKLFELVGDDRIVILDGDTCEMLGGDDGVVAVNIAAVVAVAYTEDDGICKFNGWDE